MGDGGGVEAVRPEGWPRGRGYAHGTTASGRVVHVAGQVGWDPVTHVIVAGDFVGQLSRALANVAAVVGAAGGRVEHVARMTWYITDRTAYLGSQQEIGAAYREVFGTHYPAMSVVVVAGLVEGGAMVEIEATAVVP